ncbi:MAG TPA: hypothetical protein VGC39_07640, partial [Candidatus Methylacidiphilales bacterium]
MRIALCSLIWMMLVACALADPASVRVALISDADGQDLAALVTTELSNRPTINLLERDDLAKVGDEIKLRQLAGSDAAGLGKLLGADGLVFLNKAPDGIHARLTSTALGVVLFNLQWKPDLNSVELAKLLANQIVSLAPKLEVPPEKAVLISVLNLRAEYGDPAAVRMERQITLALESQLSAIPEFLILERRHAWAMNFERSVNFAPELLHGIYLLDGSLELPTDTNPEMRASLRLRRPGADSVSFVVKGPADNPSQLANTISDQIVKAIGRSTPAQALDTKVEAREYLREGIWAARNGLPQPALEALDSAEILGETAPDLLAMRIPVLCGLAAGANSGITNPQAFRTFKSGEMPIDPHPEERLDFIFRALADATRYANGGPEQKLEILGDIVGPGTRVRTNEGKTDRLTDEVQLAASRVLWMLHQTHHPREDELRQALRSFAGFDPLHHQIPKNWFYGFEYAELWSETPDEVIAYYQILAARRPTNLLEDDLYDELNRILLKEGPDPFCGRFTPVPTEQRALFDRLVDNLIADPATKTTGLLARATWVGATDKPAAYQALLDDLSANRERLVQSDDLGIYLTSAARLQREIAKPACPEFIDLLRYDLHNIVSFRDDNYCHVWQPDLFPPEDAPSLWKEFEECKKRTLIYFARHTSADGHTIYIDDPSKLSPMFAKLEADYFQQFGKPESLPPPMPAPIAPAALVVSHTWHSWQAPEKMDHELQLQKLSGGDGLALGNPLMPFHVLSYTMNDDDTVWIYGYHDPYGSHLFGDCSAPVTLYKVHLPDLKTEAIGVPWRLNPSEQDGRSVIYFAGDNLYIIGSESMLARFNISTGEWQRREIMPRISELFPVRDKLYFSLKGEENGVVRYDWDSGQVIILADSRRRPAQNQFDDRPRYTVSNVLVTPDGKTCALIEGRNYVIQEQSGTWPLGPDMDPSAGFPTGKKAGVFWSTVQGRGYASTPTFPPYSKEWIWLRTLPEDAMDYGFRGHEVFALVRDSGFKLLWYQPYDSTPLPIPLDLKIDDETHALLASSFKFQFDQAINPATGDLRMTVSAQGICLFPTIIAGPMPFFWFLPFTEIDAYLKAHATDQRPPVLNPLSILPPEVLKNIQASMQAQNPSALP